MQIRELYRIYEVDSIKLRVGSDAMLMNTFDIQTSRYLMTLHASYFSYVYRMFNAYLFVFFLFFGIPT